MKSCGFNSPFSYLISVNINLERVALVQYLIIWVKCTLAMVYNQFSITGFTKWMTVFESWIRMFINEFLWIIYAYLSFIGGDKNLDRVIFVQNLKTWVKYAPAIIYNQFSKKCVYPVKDGIWKLNMNCY